MSKKLSNCKNYDIHSSLPRIINTFICGDFLVKEKFFSITVKSAQTPRPRPPVCVIWSYLNILKRDGSLIVINLILLFIIILFYSLNFH